MPSTIPLSNTIQVTQRFVRNAPLTFAGSNEPAISIGNWVRNFMLQPPFAWRWNRAVTSTALVIGQQDYPLALSTFGWLEQASITDTSVTPNQTFQLEVVLNLATETIQTQPTKIAARLDDDAGNITFRLMGVPDKAYTLNLSYQLASPNFVSLSDAWAPIPDFMQNVIQDGYLARTHYYLGNAEAAFATQLFMKSLIAANAGLSESQVSIFLRDEVNAQRTKQSSVTESQLGWQGRG